MLAAGDSMSDIFRPVEFFYISLFSAKSRQNSDRIDRQEQNNKWELNPGHLYDHANTLLTDLSHYLVACVLHKGLYKCMLY